MSESAYNQALGKKLAKSRANIASSYERLAELELQGLELEREHMDLTVDLLHVAQMAVAQLRVAQSTESSRQGDFGLLDGKEWVHRQTAERFLGVGAREIQKLVRQGRLSRGGSLKKPMISVTSLREYWRGDRFGNASFQDQ